MDDLKKMSVLEFAQLLPSEYRRNLKRGFTHNEQMLLKKIRQGKKKIKTHSREMIILPEMVGHKIEVHKGKSWEELHIVEEMIGHRLGEFALTRARVFHSAPGIGATKGSASVSVK